MPHRSRQTQHFTQELVTALARLHELLMRNFSISYPLPFAPMRGMNVSWLTRFCVHPATGSSAACEHDLVQSVTVDERKFKVAIKRRILNRLPML